jgi:hypothetical protein
VRTRALACVAGSRACARPVVLAQWRAWARLHQRRRITPPSSGRPKARFASFRPPLMSNVRRLSTSTGSLRWLSRLAFAFVVMSVTHRAWSCSCYEWSEVQKFERATSVFLGQVSRVREVDFLRVEVELVEIQSYKGASRVKQMVITTKGGASCGVSFRPGDTFAVFAEAGNTSTCSGTRWFEPHERHEALQWLSKPKQQAG